MSDRSSNNVEEKIQKIGTQTISLFLGMSLATLGFVLNKVLDSNFEFENRYSAYSIMGAVLLLLITTVALLTLLFMIISRYFLITYTGVDVEDESTKGEMERIRKTVIQIENELPNILKMSFILFGSGHVLAVVGFAIQLLPKIQEL